MGRRVTEFGLTYGWIDGWIDGWAGVRHVVGWFGESGWVDE